MIFGTSLQQDKKVKKKL